MFSVSFICRMMQTRLAIMMSMTRMSSAKVTSRLRKFSLLTVALLA